MRAALAVAAVLLAGSGAAAVGFRERGPLRLVLSLALGLGIWSAAYAAVLLGAGPRWMVAKDVALAAGGLALVLLGRRRTSSARGAPIGDPAPRWLAVLLAIACALSAACFVEHTYRFPDGGWDAWMVWNLRARFLFRGGEGFRAAFSPDMLFFAHQDYPFLLPGIVAQGFALFGERPLVPELVAALFGALTVAAAVGTAARLCGARAGILAGLAVAALPCFCVFASNQQSDVPLALYLLLACALIELDALPLAGFVAGLGAWTKNEGAMYAALLAAALLFRTRDARKTLRFVAAAAPLALLVAVFKLGVAPPTDLAALSTRESVLAHALDLRRWGEVALLTVRRILYFQDFALWAAAEAILLMGWMRRQPPSVLGTALFLSCAAYAPIYVLQPHPLQWIYPTSADRIFIQLWPAAVLATLLPLARTTART